MRKKIDNKNPSTKNSADRIYEEMERKARLKSEKIVNPHIIETIEQVYQKKARDLKEQIEHKTKETEVTLSSPHHPAEMKASSPEVAENYTKET